MKRYGGFTLIEVLVALAILGIAMTAVIRATSMDVSGVRHLQEKTMAMWVGQQAMNEARVGILQVTGRGPLQMDTTALGRRWYWILSQKPTRNPRINQMEVKVFMNKTDEDDDAYAVDFISYIYAFGNQKGNTP